MLIGRDAASGYSSAVVENNSAEWGGKRSAVVGVTLPAYLANVPLHCHPYTAKASYFLAQLPLPRHPRRHFYHAYPRRSAKSQP
jgi:hypothetical protein